MSKLDKGSSSGRGDSLKSNNVMGKRVAQLEKMAEAYEDLKTKYEKLEGELTMCGSAKK